MVSQPAALFTFRRLIMPDVLIDNSNILIDNSMNGGILYDAPVINSGSIPISEQTRYMEEISAALNTSQRLFIVAGIMDLTNFIKVPTYQVNLLDGYDEWTDSNKYTHRDIHSRKAKGSFEVVFETIEQFQTFMVVMNNNKKQNGSYDCTVYCNNKLSTISAEMYIDFEAANVMPYLGIKEVETLKVTVEQRGNQYVQVP